MVSGPKPQPDDDVDEETEGQVPEAPEDVEADEDDDEAKYDDEQPLYEPEEAGR